MTLDLLETLTYTPSMRLFFGLLFVALQLRPMAGVVVCAHNAAHEQEKCSMPMSGDESNSKQPARAPATDCSQMAACAPAIPVIAPSVEQLTANYASLVTYYSSPASLLLGDPTAPPQPPPIA